MRRISDQAGLGDLAAGEPEVGVGFNVQGPNVGLSVTARRFYLSPRLPLVYDLGQPALGASPTCTRMGGYSP